MNNLETPVQPATQSHNLILFRLGKQLFAMPLDPIVQIIPMVTILSIPKLSNSVLGVINVHGKATPVVDMRRLLNLPEADLKLYTPIILAKINTRLVGLVVDDVIDVINLPEMKLVAINDVLLQEMGEVRLLLGLAQVEDRLIPLINPDCLFIPEQAQVLAETVDRISPRTLRIMASGDGAPQPKKRHSPGHSKTESALAAGEAGLPKNEPDEAGL